MRARRIALLTGLALTFGVGPALAAWDASGAGSATAAADTLRPVTGLAVTRQGRNLITTFSQTAMGDGKLPSNVAGSFDVLRNGASACSTTALSFTGASGSCTVKNVSPGTQPVIVTPKLGPWVGPNASFPIEVPAPNMVMGAVAFTNNRYTSTGTLDGFLDGELLSYYRLDGANNTTTTIDGSLTTVPANQASKPTTVVTMPCSSSTASSHTINVPSDQGNVAGTLAYDFTSVLCPVSAQTGSVADGRAATGDVIALAFNQAVDGNTICAGISAVPNTADNLVATITDGGGSNSDTLTLTAPAPNGGLLGLYQVNGACGAMTPGTTLGGGPPVTGTVNLGTVSLGSPNYVTSGSVAFGGSGRALRTTLSLSPAGTVLLTLGTGTTSPAVGSPAVATANPRWTPAGTTTSGAKSAQGFALGTAPLL